MNYGLPTELEFDGQNYKIRNNGDYRMVLDVIAALKDDELTSSERLQVALYIFYEEYQKIIDIETAIDRMMWFLNNGETEKDHDSSEKPIMDWNHDFKLLVAPINKILGVEIRAVPYLHWWTFLSGYMEIGEGTFQTVISIRKKRQKGQKLENWEREFYQKNRSTIDLPSNLTEEEKEFLELDF